MGKTFVSVPVKLLCLIVGTLLLLSAAFSVLSIWRLQQEFKEFQQEQLDQSKAQFSLDKSALANQLRIWVESFSDIIHLNEKNDYTEFVSQLESEFYALQLHLNVENVWLVDEKFETLFSTQKVSPFIIDLVKDVIAQQQPLNRLYCENACQLIVSVPLINAKGELAIVTMSSSLIDILYTLNQSLNSDVAVLSFPDSEWLSLNTANFISASNSSLMLQLFSGHNARIDIETATQKGIQIGHEETYYLLNLLPLAKNNLQNYYLALVDDVTEFKLQNEEYRRYFLLTVILIFIALAVLVYFVTSPFTRRLMSLANALPLLSRKEFSQFRQVKLHRRHFFVDELDVLAESAQELSFELEQLNMEVEQKTKELENIAMYDILTGLPNRNMLNFQLRKAVANMSRSEGGLAVLFLDLDDFKKVNDSHGHTDGDKLLIEAANRVRTSIRKVDIACRFGGDEFVVILSQVTSVHDAIRVAEDILQRFKAPIKVGSSIFYVSTSIGIVFTNDEAIHADDLVSQADIAMYEAKDNGGAQFNIYHSDMYLRVAKRVLIEGEVRQALIKGQFSLSLQPQLLAKSKKLYGFEALLRWHHPERGMISPDDFIPVLENSEYMVELGYWVIRRCFELVETLKETGLPEVRIAINMSAAQFMDPDLPDYLSHLMDRFNLPAKHFELELTEQTLVKDIDRAIDVMNVLKDDGFSFAIDDFGTGYSSLAYLKKMPVDVIKIDKSFVFGMLENHSDYQIIMSTIAMVKNLGLIVVAEGVESSAQLRSLTQNECDIIQGYYFSKPVPEKELISFVEEQITNGYWKTKVNK